MVYLATPGIKEMEITAANRALRHIIYKLAYKPNDRRNIERPQKMIPLPNTNSVLTSQME
jgi:hypothetical protein